LPTAPNTAIGGIFTQCRIQGRQTLIVQQGLGPFVVASTVTQAGKARRIPTIDQLVDPTLRKPRHPRRLRDGIVLQQKPDHLHMRPAAPVALDPIGPIQRRELRPTQHHLAGSHKLAPHILWISAAENHKCWESIKRIPYYRSIHVSN